MTKKKSHAWLNCSEAELAAHIHAFVKDGFSPVNSLLFLEGEMGAGKSTFVRELLSILAPGEKSLGSPTFPLVTEYHGHVRNAQDLEQTHERLRYPIYHIDLYRLKNEQELMDSGIEEQIEDEGSLVCIEWASLFADSFAHWFTIQQKRKSVYVLRIESSDHLELRDYYLEEI